jgi:hypothetical protein
MDSEIAPDKAELLGYLAAEGNEYHYAKTRWRFFSDRSVAGKWYLIHYRQDAVEFTNLEPTIQQRFLHLLQSVYGAQRVHFGSRWRVRIRQKNIVSDLLRHSRLGSLEWKVPSSLMDSHDHVKAAWCRGYVDGDGTVGNRRVCLDSVNLSGLNQVKDLLESMAIKSKLNGPYRQLPHLDRYSLVVYNPSLRTFSQLIGFNHPSKKYRLNQLCGGPVAPQS